MSSMSFQAESPFCIFCGDQFNDVISMKQHMAVHQQQNEDEKREIEARKEEIEIKNEVIEPMEIKIEVIEPVEIKMGWDGVESYTCVLCSRVFKDLGLHLCVSHGMVKCRTDRRCKLFFGSLEERETHEMSSHSDSPYLFPTSCQKCKSLKFSDQFDLASHRFNQHKMLTCTLCGYLTSGGKGFDKHLEIHQLDNTLKSIVETNGYMEFISHPISTVNKETKNLDCNLCVEKKVTILADENGEAFLHHFQEHHDIRKPADNLFKLFNGENFNFKNLNQKVLTGFKRPATDIIETQSKKQKVNQGRIPSHDFSTKERYKRLSAPPSKPLNLPEEVTVKAEPTGNLTWGTIIPLIGGSAIGCSKSAGNLPSFHLSYTPFSNNEKHLDRYWPDVPKYQLDKEPNVAFQGIDYINSVCPCAGLSMLNTGRNTEGGVARGSDNETNKWMFDTSAFVLEKIKPKVLWGENAPGLFSGMGEAVVEGLIEIGKKFGYSFSIIKTNSELHGLPQKRIRTFYFFWNTPTVPMLTWKNRPAKSFKDFLAEIPKDATQQDIFMNYGKASERFRPYQFVLEREGLTHAEFYKKMKGGTISRYLEKHDLELECIEWLQKKYPNETFSQNKSTGRTHVQYIEHCMNKKSMGKGYWDDSPRFYDRSMGALMSKSMFTSVHPVEDRYLNVREMMHIMGLPHDFEIDHVKNINHIAQNVPVNTAKDMADEVKLFCEGKLPLTEYSFLKQDNITQTIVLATELGQTSKNKPVVKQVVKKEAPQENWNVQNKKSEALQNFNKSFQTPSNPVIPPMSNPMIPPMYTGVSQIQVQNRLRNVSGPVNLSQIGMQNGFRNPSQIQIDDGNRRLTRAARRQDPTLNVLDYTGLQNLFSNYK